MDLDYSVRPAPVQEGLVDQLLPLASAMNRLFVPMTLRDSVAVDRTFECKGLEGLELG